MSLFALISFSASVFVSKRMGEVVLGTCSDPLDSDLSISLLALLRVPECLNILFDFLILPESHLMFLSLTFLQFPGEVAMVLESILTDTALKTQN